MNETERLNEALKCLRDADAGREAPVFLETRLRAAFREQHAVRRRRRWVWLSAAATAVVAVLVVWKLANPEAVVAPPSVTQQQKVAVVPVEKTPKPVVASAPPPAKRKPATALRKPLPPPPVEAVDAATSDQDFFALPYAPPFGATDRGHVMRVGMPRQTLRRLGLPVNEERIFERIPADVLVGEDGIPRAIRIVSTTR